MSGFCIDIAPIGWGGLAQTGPSVSMKTSGGFTISQGAYEWLGSHFTSGRASEDETSDTIRQMAATTGEIICPHTAVGVHVANAHLGPTPMVTLATAHPAKFPDAVQAATGTRPPLPSRMADLYERSERVTRVSHDLAAIQALIRERIMG